MLSIPKIELGRLLDIKQQNVDRIFTNKRSLMNKISEIHDLGCSIDWLLTGNGPVIAKNTAGMEILKKCDKLTEDGYLKNQAIVIRIISWVIFNYDSTDKFSKLFNCPQIEVLNNNKNELNYPIDDEVYKKIILAGCNPGWIFNNNEISPYSLNENGIKLRKEKKSNVFKHEFIKFQIENN